MRFNLELVCTKIKKFFRETFRDQIFYKDSKKNLKIFRIFLEDIYIFDTELYFILLKKPEKIFFLFEFTLKTIIKRSFENYNKNFEIDNLQIILLRRFFNAIPKKISEILEGEFISLKVSIISVGPRRIKRLNKINHLNYEKSKNTIKSNSRNYFYEPVNSNGHIHRWTNHLDYFFDYQTAIATSTLEVDFQHSEFMEFVLVLERNLVAKVFPGDEIFISGISKFYYTNLENTYDESYAKKKKQVIKVLGFSKINFSDKYQPNDFYENLDKKFIKFARSKNIYKWITSLIIPDVDGFLDIKQALSCLLFGGNEKILANDFIFYGQINILMLGKENEIFVNIKNYFKKLSLVVKKNNNNTTKEANLILERNSFGEINRLSTNLDVLLIEKFEILDFKEHKDLGEIMKPHNFLKEKFFFKNPSNIVSTIAFMDRAIKKNFFQSKNYLPENIISLENLKKFDLIMTIPSSPTKSVNKKIVNLLNEFDFKSGKTAGVKLNGSNDAAFEFLTNYITFVRKKFRPKISKKASEFIKNAYVFLRMSKKYTGHKDSPTINRLKQIESMIKISEAIGKMRMSKEIESGDALEAIRMVQTFGL